MKRMGPRVQRLARKLRPVLPYGILANLAQWLTRDTHEPDFDIFEWLSEADGLVLDVGASRGQSAISVLRRTRRLCVFSFEPNRKHRWSLLLIRLLHPFRFLFRLVAAGNDYSRKTLYVPGRRASGLSAQGSLDPAEFEKDYVHERLQASGFDAGDKQAYRLLTVPVVPLDSFALAPDLVKLDVEGFELQALNGLERTLESHLPVLMIENNNPERWLPLLESIGYDFYHYDQLSGSLRKYDGRTGVLNLFCLNRRSDSLFTSVLMQNVDRDDSMVHPALELPRV